MGRYLGQEASGWLSYARPDLEPDPGARERRLDSIHSLSIPEHLPPFEDVRTSIVYR